MLNRNRELISSGMALLVAAGLNIGLSCGVCAQDAATGSDEGNGKSAPAEAWQEKLNRQDRAALDAAIGFAPPEFNPSLRWIGSAPLTWPSLRGKVVVIQSWTSGTSAARREPQLLRKALGEVNEADVQLIALHTPDNADKAEVFLERQPAEVPVVIDPTGEFCDALGIFKRPVNVVIDRNGTVRFAGLHPAGVKEAVTMLLGERADPGAKPLQRTSADAADSSGFPAISGDVRSAADKRGQRAPDFFVEQWINERPDDPRKNGQVLVLDFWATWCGPCVASIPHMNELADRFRGKVVCVGISDEKPDEFEDGILKRKLKLDSFKYHLALDPKATMKSFFGVRGIPNIAVISSDWTVRWQGHPQQLTVATLEQIVKANDALVAGKGDKSGSKDDDAPAAPGEPPKRWQNER
jgi:thiol-disulfide isomerase/thioredoxin